MKIYLLRKKNFPYEKDKSYAYLGCVKQWKLTLD